MTNDFKDFHAWLDHQINDPGRESMAGYHFIQSFFQDPYTFYLRYLRGLRPVYTKPALTKGSIIHAAIEAAYRYGAAAADTTVNALFAARKDSYMDTQQHETDHRDCAIMVRAWITKWLDHDIALDHILHLEETFTYTLPSGHVMTLKPDIIIQRKDSGEILARDHKTTGWSLMSGHNALADTDQPTTYIAGMKQLYPRNSILGVESDVMFKRTNMHDCKCERVGIVQRTDAYIREWELSTVSWLQDIQRRVEMLEAGYPPHFAFPRGQSQWGTADFADIYRMELPADPTVAPYGYVIDDWAQSMIAHLKENNTNAEAT